MRGKLCAFVLIFLVGLPCVAQVTKLVPWIDASSDNPLVYRPEPILFVHGINANDAGWQTTLNSLEAVLGRYQEPDTLPVDAALQRATQYPYLHTFNYGDRPGQSTLNRSGFEHVEWNASAGHRDYMSFTNIFTGAIQLAPHDGRQTLDERVGAIRDAYEVIINGISRKPEIVLVAHSMGGLLCHHYLIWNSTTHHVRRHVTIATPHQGSHIANWLLSYQRGDPAARMINGVAPLFVIYGLRFAAGHASPTAGFFRYADLGGVEDLSVFDHTGPSHLRGNNDLMDFFWNNPGPKIESVFNVYSRPPLTTYVLLHIATADSGLSAVQIYGDGLVAQYSAAGKTAENHPSVYNGLNNPNGTHAIDPVIFGVWHNLDHTAAVSHTNSLIRSIDGVPYSWPGSNPSDWPDYARTYDENQSFAKYFDLPVSGPIGYFDTPAISDLVLLYSPSSGLNRLVVPSFSTWVINASVPEKSRTNVTDFAGHQIIYGGPVYDTVLAVGKVGTKNRSETPADGDGLIYYTVAGNEYLPASLGFRVQIDTDPIPPATDITPQPEYFVTHCLVQLDGSGIPEYQYGYFRQAVGGESLVITTNRNFVAAQTKNLGELTSRQAEQAFDVPVDSATLAAILTNINLGEALSNQCHAASEPTRWTATVSEWATVPSNGVVTPNFFPVDASPNVRDAWTGTDFTGFNYDEINKTLTVTDPADAPSQLIISNQVYLGCAQVFTNDYDGVVTNLDGTVIESWSVQYTADIWWE